MSACYKHVKTHRNKEGKLQVSILKSDQKSPTEEVEKDLQKAIIVEEQGDDDNATVVQAVINDEDDEIVEDTKEEPAKVDISQLNLEPGSKTTLELNSYRK